MTGPTLVVCEKPTAAKRIAQALDDAGRPGAYRERGVPYFVARRGGRELLVVSALGHLFTVAQSGGGWTYPVFDLKWVPAYEANKSAARTQGFIKVIEKLSRDAEGYVSACDYDMEGSLIAYTVLLHICGEESPKRARRMRYSTLTDQDIVRAWEKMPPTLDFPLIEAGRARHEVDWLFGINLSRALTLSVKNATGYYRTLSSGRVQGPTLNFIKAREVEVRTFVPTPFWVIEAETEIDGKRYTLEYARPRIGTEREALEVEAACRGREGIITAIRSRRHRLLPPHPFSLGDLQRESYRQFRYAPRTTLRAAERLYLNALISYPRTSSQRLPPSIDLAEILKGLRSRRAYADLAERLLSKPALRPRQGKKDDPAHPAIYPTGNPPGKLGKAQSRVYDLICRRFMATLGDPAVRQRTDAEVDVNGHLFRLRGSRILEQGWVLFYRPYVKEKEAALPALRKGQVLPLIRLEAFRKQTKPPPRFNPSSLLKLMEDEMIGTKATRTDIVDTLFKRGYVDGNPITITDLGFAIVETLSNYCPEILSVEMTRRLEKDLELIQTGEIPAEGVVNEAIEMLEPILKEFKAKERLIGTEINEALRAERLRANVLGPCPVCGTGEMRLIRNKRTGKRFAGCSNYFNGSCSASFPLPQRGRIQSTGRSCPKCGAPIIRVISRGRRPWDLCVNFECPSKKRGGKRGG
ncbi:MAG: DNA topoisomerase I [Candidatus Bathyarchaeota archaeon]|nr:DNA topoisomerase I [Candidatus Bathyarchaeota archaeon]